MDLPPEEVELRENDSETRDRCAHCHRTLLTGEHMYVCGDDRIVCELCIRLEPDMPREAQLVHGPEMGQTIRIVDKRSSDGAAPHVRRRRSRRATLPPPRA